VLLKLKRFNDGYCWINSDVIQMVTPGKDEGPCGVHLRDGSCLLMEMTADEVARMVNNQRVVQPLGSPAELAMEAMQDAAHPPIGDPTPPPDESA
jgi:hypothetical protein